MNGIDTSNFAYLGTTVQHPLSLSSTGKASLVSGTRTIAQSIRFILGTRLGSFFGYPNLGSKLYLLLFEISDSVFQSLAKTFIRDAIESQENRVSFIDCGFIRNNQISISIIVQYRILSSNEIGQLTFPFERKNA